MPFRVWAAAPDNITPAVEAVELSVKVPLLVKLPYNAREAFAALAIVTLDAGKVVEMVRFLTAAAVPELITGIELIPVPFVMTTSVLLVGTVLLHQLVEVPQLLVVPIQPPVDRTVITAVAEVLVQAPEVIFKW